MTPSRRRRNLQRRNAWLEKKKGSEVPPAFSKPFETDPPTIGETMKNIPKESENGPVWNLETIPQLDGAHGHSENPDDVSYQSEETDEKPDEHEEYVMPSNNWNMRIFMKTSLNLNNIRNADSIPNCYEIKREIRAIFEENEINIKSIVDITKGVYNGDCAIVYLQIEQTKKNKVSVLAENWNGKNKFLLWESLL